MSAKPPDLANLVRQSTDTPHTGRRRAAWLLPFGVLLGFGAIFLGLFRDRLLPARHVEVTPAPAIASHPPSHPPPDGTAAVAAVAAPAAGRLLFQASGWIEPEPLPLKVTALTDGFVDEVHVLEGATVKKGDLLATLIDTDARLVKETAAAELAMREAGLAALEAARGAAEGKLAATRAELASAEADATEAADKLRRIERTGEAAVPETERVTARYENARRQAALLARQAAIDETTKEIERLAHEAEAMKAGVTAAKTALAKAALDLERTRIVAPMDGRVARLLAVPGQKKMAKMDDIDSATIVILYDPAKVQARVDVPLADAAGLSVGQPVKIRCNLLPEQPFDGVVTRINGEADLQRNTLQAKVRLLQPSDRLRPEMLCRAEFYEPRGATPAAPGAPAAGSNAALAVYVPEDSLTESAVWICDPDTSRVSRRAVAAASESRDGFRRLDSGVLPGEWVVRRPSDLRANQRVWATRVP